MYFQLPFSLKPLRIRAAYNSQNQGQGCATPEFFGLYICTWTKQQTAHHPQTQLLGLEVSFVISLWQFVGLGFVLRMRSKGWRLPGDTFTCSETSLFATPAGQIQEYWDIRKLFFSWAFHPVLGFFIRIWIKEWKVAQSRPAMSLFKGSVTNHALTPL